MEDLAVSDDLGRILVTMLDAGKVVSSVCHGPAGLLPAKRADGSLAVRRTQADRLHRRRGAAGRARRPGALAAGVLPARGRSGLLLRRAWAPFVVVDDNLVTGQNPASSAEAAQKVLELLKA